MSSEDAHKLATTIVVQYKSQRRAIFLPATFQGAIDVIKEAFPSVDIDFLALRGWTQDSLGTVGESPVLLTEDSWAQLASSITKIVAYTVTDFTAAVYLNAERRAVLLPETYSDFLTEIGQAFKTAISETAELRVHLRGAETRDSAVLTPERWSELSPRIQTIVITDTSARPLHPPHPHMVISPRPRPGITYVDPLASGSMGLPIPMDCPPVPPVGGSPLLAPGRRPGGVVGLRRKPVIYLLTPHPMDVHVRLGLAPQWKFSAIYPETPILRSSSSDGCKCIEAIEWKVKAHPDGVLTDASTNIDVTYLFWEAEPIPTSDTPPASPVVEGLVGQVFIPGTSGCDTNNSVLLPATDVTTYLLATLIELGLHTEARTSFITFWLPFFLKHRFLALRFLTQAEYDSAAPLNITPHPDYTSRVFMLFRGVEAAEVGLWADAEDRAKMHVSFWNSVVGTNAKRSNNAALFRVIEWGGMEVSI